MLPTPMAASTATARQRHLLGGRGKPLTRSSACSRDRGRSPRPCRSVLRSAAAAVDAGLGRGKTQEKNVLFEKKNQKTSAPLWPWARPNRPAKVGQKFLFIFPRLLQGPQGSLPGTRELDTVLQRPDPILRLTHMDTDVWLYHQSDCSGLFRMARTHSVREREATRRGARPAIGRARILGAGREMMTFGNS
jgi:hypothetical protein